MNPVALRARLTGRMGRQPCASCPWKRSTPRGGFPGGTLKAPELLAMVHGEGMAVMQCHATPDEEPRGCVGFIRRCDTPGVRLMGILAPETVTVDREHPPLRELHTVKSVMRKHGSLRGGECAARCRGCISRKCKPKDEVEPE